MALEYGYFDSEITGYDDEGMPEFDRAKTSDFLADFLSQLITSGVFADPATNFQVQATGTGMQVSIEPGYACLKGRFAYDEEVEYITLEDAPTVTAYKRIDLIVLRNNYPNRLCELIVKKGEEATTPVAPTLERNADYFEVALCKINISSNQSVISQANITDTRWDSDYCGAVTQLIDHLDTSVFFAQLEAFFADYEEATKEHYKEYVTNTENTYDEYVKMCVEYYEKLLEILGDYEGSMQKEFEEWFESIKEILSGDVAGNLELRIEEVESKLEQLKADIVAGNVQSPMLTEDGQVIVTEDGEKILAERTFK